MELFQTVKKIRERIKFLKANEHTIGFVPTMGALHDGHLSLIEEAKKQTDIVIASIFVNPTQFNNPKDLEKYPRDLERDKKILKKAGCNILFNPTVKDIYPKEDKRVFDFGVIDKVMEGKHRPGHFNGVAQVVSKLFEITEPDKAFFGLKDFQQVAVINAMIKQLNLDVKIAECPTVREIDGLAMSSRNRLLKPETRKIVPIIANSLIESCKFAENNSISKTKKFVTEKINSENLLKIEYFEIVDGESLQPVENWDQSDYIVGCIAVYANEVRLIDNVIYKNNR